MAATTLRTYTFLDALQPQLASFIGKTARGFLPVPGMASLFFETEPAGYVAFAANEAEKAARVFLISVTPFGAFGRLYMSGPEAEIDAAAAAATAALESITGKTFDKFVDK